MAESQKVRMSLQDLKVKSFATTPSLQRDEGTVRGLDTCGQCTITTFDDPACGECTMSTYDTCDGQTQACGNTCIHTQGGTGDGGSCTNVTGGTCDAVSNGCVTTYTGGESCYDTCQWGAISNF